tara:strand:+ start:570 stop:1523 length:954 start_codon:yes stop_codon:yes gene_type:complete
MEVVEQLRITSTNLRSILITSNERLNQLKTRRLKLKKQREAFRLRDEKSKKLGTKSKFTSSLRKIRGKTPPIIKDPIGGLLTIASLLILGFVVNNIEFISQKIQSALTDLKNTFVPITEVIQDIYDSASGFVKMFRDETKTDDFKKINDELEQTSSVVDEVKKDFESIQNQMSSFNKGYNIGQVMDTGEMPDGSGTYDKVMLYDKEQKEVIPYYRITDPNGNITIVKVSDFMNELFQDADNNGIIDYEKLQEKGKSFYKEKKNQWWDWFNVIPNGIEFDEDKFKNIEGLPNTLSNYKSNSSSVSEVKILRQPVIVDP